MLVVHGMGGGIRTPDRRIRNPMLYPTELRPQTERGLLGEGGSWQAILASIGGGVSDSVHGAVERLFRRDYYQRMVMERNRLCLLCVVLLEMTILRVNHARALIAEVRFASAHRPA